jgi:acetyl-CoA synthetase
MPKKKKKSKTKRKPSKKRRKIIKRKSPKKRKVTKRKIKSNKKVKTRIKKTDNVSSDLIFKTKQEWIKNSLANKSKYQNKYKESIKNNNSFWKKEGKRITWIKPYKKIKDVKYSKEEVRIKWYEDGTLNASSNCIDRHLKDKKDKTAIIWVGDDPNETLKISYKQLHQKVSKAANGLKKLGIKKGDRVTIYLTMIPELAVLMLACARIGAIH